MYFLNLPPQTSGSIKYINTHFFQSSQLQVVKILSCPKFPLINILFQSEYVQLQK